MTLNKKTLISMVLAGSLVVTMCGCAKEEVKVETGNIDKGVAMAINEEITEIDTIKSEITDASVKDKSNITQEEIDQVAIDYFNDLGKEAKGLWDDIKQNGVESAHELEEKAKEIAVKVWDFKNNKFSIHGIYYSDLSENGKKVIDGIFGGLNDTLQMIAPNLKEDLTNLFGEEVVKDAINAKNNIKDLGSDLLDRAEEGIDKKIESFRK